MRYDMSLNWNDEAIPSEADKTTDILGFKEVGGVGQLIYHPFRFNKYELDIDKGDNYCVTPFCRPEYEPIFPKEDFLSGQGLLASLCNLAMQINSFDNKIQYTQLIMEWCTSNMHPYNIDFIYSELNESFDINSFDAEMVERDGTFEINTFLDDLGKLYNAVMFYVTLEGVCISDDEAAYDLPKEGKYFEGYSFFDKYKHPIVAIPDDDCAELRNALIDIIPEFTMKLKIDPRTNRLEFSTDINSVFDIAWLTLARMLSEDPVPEDKGKSDNRPEGIMIRCRNCGKFIIRKSNRQAFCDAEECQKVRNARKQKAYRERKAIEKAQKSKKKAH